MLHPMPPAQWRTGSFQFTLIADDQAPAAPYQRELWVQPTDRPVHLRTFYFEEAQPDTIHMFCQRYAGDADYRAAIAAGKAPYQMRDALFVRNAFNPYFQPNPALDHLGSLARLFEFMTLYHHPLRALPDYQRIQTADCADAPHSEKPDTHIAPAVAAWNALDGVRTLASCQGVSGTIRYQGIDDILTVSPHARYGYLWFATLPSQLVPVIKDYAAQNPHLIFSTAIHPELRSAGDNVVFRRELRALAFHLAR